MELKDIESKIYFINGFKVMLDSDLAELYGVETKVLNQALKRNIHRFPSDFMFQLNKEEVSKLINSHTHLTYLGLRNSNPNVFTENGVAMLSSILNSERAIQINIQIMRLFTKLRSYLLLEENLNNRIDHLEQETGRTFRIVLEELESIKDQVKPLVSSDRKKIGLK